MRDQPTWRIWVVLVLAVAIQTTWLARLRLGGAHLDLPLMTVVSVALLLGWETGAIYGTFAGILTGFFVGDNIGSFALSRLITGGVLGLFDKRFSRDNPFTPPLCMIGAIILSNLVMLVMAPTDYPLAWWARHTLSALPAHAILIWPLHWLINRFVLPPSRLMFS